MSFQTAGSRSHSQTGDAEVWQCVPDGGFGELLELEEAFLSPLAALPTLGDTETLFYLSDGALAGGSDLILAGAFQQIEHGGMRANASRTEGARVFTMKLSTPDAAPTPGRAVVWFSAAERRGRLRLVASRTAKDGSLKIPHDVQIYSSLLDAGQHIVCELEARRCVWLHMVSGSATVMGQVVETSDGVGVDAVRAVGITAREGSELLLFDLPGRA